VATSDGPEPIPEETARRLLEGAEVLDLTAVDASPEFTSGRPGAELKLPVRGIVKTEVVADPHPPSSTVHEADEPRVEHAANLSTGRPPVPPEERDRPNDAELRKRVLSRDGYFCVIPGCSGIAEQANHIEGREQGGPTTDENECGLCIPHHVLCTAGEIHETIDLGDAGFQYSSLASSAGDSSRRGAISAIVLHLREPMTLQPDGTQRIARLTLTATIGPGGEAPPLLLHFEDGMKDEHCCPVSNIVTFNGTSYSPVLEHAASGTPCPRPFFRRGDSNGDGAVDLSDPIVLLDHLFRHEPPALPCRKAADADDSGALEVTDAIVLLGHLFLGSAEVPPPHEHWGIDPTPDELACPLESCPPPRDR
jgi:hypothetical protein